MDHEYDLTPRGLYRPTPSFRPTFLDHPTLLITYWCSGLCIFLIVSRLFWRFVRLSKVYRDDWWMVASIIPLGVRLGLIHLVLINGTNNTTFDGFDDFRIPQEGKQYLKWGLDEEIRRREKGSKIVLAARVALAAFIWSQKLCITEFYRKLNLSYWNASYRGILDAIRWSLVVSLLGVVVSIFAECNPFHTYWQVVPDPGPHCREGIAPLIVMAVFSAVTDLMIVVFPLPPILMGSMPLKRKFWLIVSLSLSLITCALAIYRVSFVLSYRTSQPHRTLYSSLECLASCAIANATVLNSFARDKGPKRNKYRGPGDAHTVYSPEAIAKRGITGDQEQAYALDVQSTRLGMRVWGSDEDLVKSTGLGMNRHLRKMSDAARRQSGLSSSSDRDSCDLEAVTNTEENGVYAPWVAAWEQKSELWSERSENGSGRGLILPPPPPPLVYSGQLSSISSDFSHSTNIPLDTMPSLRGIAMPSPAQRLPEGNANNCEDSASRKVSFYDVGGLLAQDGKSKFDRH